MSTRILLADDHRILREGLRSLLAQERDIEVVGEASDGEAQMLTTREQEVIRLLADGKRVKRPHTS